MNKDMKEQIIEELRQCEGAREFVPFADNYYLFFNHRQNELAIGLTRWIDLLRTMVVFPTEDLAEKAIETVGEDRIKRYLFGVKSPLDKLVDKASDIVGETLIVDGNMSFNFVLTDEEGSVYFGLNGGDFTFTFGTQWHAFRELSSSQRKQLVEAILDYYEEVEG